MTTKFEMDGWEDLNKALEGLEKLSTQKAALRKALAKAAQPMADDARSRAPKGPTGNLQNSITVSGKLNKSQTRAAKGDKVKHEVNLYVGPSWPKGAHAHLVEFGTAPHKNKGKFAGSDHPGTSPKPFMRPAFEAGTNKLLIDLGEEMWIEINKAVKNQARRQARAARRGQ
ncbi:HK97-gp10 family putative phage morphogenesis protein [Pseudogemmobacter bohemicus]|uniref:HK97-gp10 family putative phage morphogenesis protein n=1 Tax=Pseudogemmobacter bohemicus TaxID=2250708 RepID=UPI000DD4BC3B|nr:HK97-gp10 family putative phage morphogenesis protein [Pseudogemmobacter bohemicus]